MNHQKKIIQDIFYAVTRLKVDTPKCGYGNSNNGTKFRQYAMETAAMLNEKYPHKLLTPTLHKILAHGGDFIEYQSLRFGELFGEAQE